ncbi:MAG: type II toxin-antitoxin system RelE/ParE family toxin [Verrucomicrobiales bacterium]
MKPLRYHPAVQSDINEAIGYYFDISPKVAEAFWSELSEVLHQIEKRPGMGHIDPSGLRRVNLQRFPFHILPDRIRIQIIRHNSRHPRFGVARRKH